MDPILVSAGSSLLRSGGPVALRTVLELLNREGTLKLAAAECFVGALEEICNDCLKELSADEQAADARAWLGEKCRDLEARLHRIQQDGDLSGVDQDIIAKLIPMLGKAAAESKVRWPSIRECLISAALSGGDEPQIFRRHVRESLCEMVLIYGVTAARSGTVRWKGVARSLQTQVASQMPRPQVKSVGEALRAIDRLSSSGRAGLSGKAASLPRWRRSVPTASGPGVQDLSAIAVFLLHRCACGAIVVFIGADEDEECLIEHVSESPIATKTITVRIMEQLGMDSSANEFMDRQRISDGVEKALAEYPDQDVLVSARAVRQWLDDAPTPA